MTADFGERGFSQESEGLRSWRWALAGGWFPIMGVGFTFSALADRLVFVVWGLAAALIYSWSLRRGYETGKPAAFGLLALTASWLTLGWLVSRHQESLDFGCRAFLPSLYHPWISNPRTMYGLGVVSGMAAAISWQRSQ